MDIRVRAFGKTVGYLSTLIGSVIAMIWLIGSEFISFVFLGIAICILVYSIYDYILEGMKIDEKLNELEKK